ncbi:hypothetical protein ACA910_015800 [Epithemia clementina (nom. ined.)]
MMYFYNNPRSFAYQRDCIITPIFPSAIAGVVFSGLDVLQGLPAAQAFRPRSVGFYMAIIYAYNILQCPMEFVHGRQSLLHNIISAGTLGYIGVNQGRVGVPFVDYSFYYRYPQFSPATMGFVVYGGIAGLLAAIQGKRL